MDHAATTTSPHPDSRFCGSDFCCEFGLPHLARCCQQDHSTASRHSRHHTAQTNCRSHHLCKFGVSHFTRCLQQGHSIGSRLSHHQIATTTHDSFFSSPLTIPSSIAKPNVLSNPCCCSSFQGCKASACNAQLPLQEGCHFNNNNNGSNIDSIDRFEHP